MMTRRLSVAVVLSVPRDVQMIYDYSVQRGGGAKIGPLNIRIYPPRSLKKIKSAFCSATGNRSDAKYLSNIKLGV